MVRIAACGAHLLILNLSNSGLLEISACLKIQGFAAGRLSGFFAGFFPSPAPTDISFRHFRIGLL
jgi:hypothetical protein